MFFFKNQQFIGIKMQKGRIIGKKLKEVGKYTYHIFINGF